MSPLINVRIFKFKLYFRKKIKVLLFAKFLKFKATKDLSGSAYLPVTQWYYIYSSLENHMNDYLKLNQVEFKDGIKKMKNKFNEYWPKFKDYALLCMILDPRFKLYFLLNLNEKKQAKDLFILNFNRYSLKAKTSNPESTIIHVVSNSDSSILSASSKNKQKDKNLSMMERFFEGAKSKSSKSNKTEYQNYFDEPNIRFCKNFDVLGFWKENQLKFPILASMVKDFLSIQPTSVSSERCFSQSGLIVTNLRNQLHPETVRQVMCLKSWNISN